MQNAPERKTRCIHDLLRFVYGMKEEKKGRFGEEREERKEEEEGEKKEREGRGGGE